jgi:hypothetical protein
MPPREALEFWHTSNVCLWYFFTALMPPRRMCIKYEDILLNPKVVQGVFQFIGEQYSEQYLRYGDFDHAVLNCPIFMKGRIDLERIDANDKTYFSAVWKEYQNSNIVVEMGYNSDFFD